MSFQPLFRRFHEAIQLKRFVENKELRDKRDKILDRLRERLPKEAPSFEPFNQGSYDMGTGIRPLDGDYDIDVGILFNINYTEADPITVKGWVHGAVENHTARVEWRRPCITVYYQEGGEPVYHVDLAIFAKDPRGGPWRLAIGKQHSAADQREWQPDERVAFAEDLDKKFSGEDAAQLRRVVRYLKRWKDVHFASEGRAKPTGLGLTVAAYFWFAPRTISQGGSVEHDDLGATLALVSAILQRFQQVWADGRLIPRISLQFPRAPRDDVFGRMTNQQMLEFHQRLEKLKGWLEEAKQKSDVAPLRRAFGDSFPEK